MSYHVPTTPTLTSTFDVPPTPPSDATPTVSKLKRLSLVARPSRPSSADPRSPPLYAPPFSPPLSDAAPSSSRLVTRQDALSPPPTGLGPATPRRANAAKRSSISYSPAVTISGLARPPDRSEPVDEAARRSSSEDGAEGNEPRGQGRAQTLTDRHADLLRLIAMRERRVNELRQELEQQEASLQSLKNRWQTIVSRTTSSHTMSVASSTSSLSSADDDSLGALGAAGLGALGLSPAQAQQGIGAMISEVVPEAIQEGKKFWGQLMKTVGAAAAGSVPDEQGGLDLSGLRSVLPPIPSFSLTAASSEPARPSRPEPVRLRPVSPMPTTAARTKSMPTARVGRTGSGDAASSDGRSRDVDARQAPASSAAPAKGSLEQELQEEMEEEGDGWGW